MWQRGVDRAFWDMAGAGLCSSGKIMGHRVGQKASHGGLLGGCEQAHPMSWDTHPLAACIKTPHPTPTLESNGVLQLLALSQTSHFPPPLLYQLTLIHES